MARHKASCHCGALQLDFEAPGNRPVTLCNCSICNMSGYEHVFVPQMDAEITGRDNLSLYTFGTGAAQHYFCKICGIKPFYVPKSHPDSYSVNLRCVIGATIEPSQIIEFDGQNWDSNIEQLRSKT